MVFDQKQTDRLLICVDSASMDLIQDLYKDSAKIKTLVMMCQFNDAYLVGHAQRIGLMAKDSPPEVIERLLPTLRQDVWHEHHQLIDAQFPQSYQIHEEAGLEENAVPLAEFLGISTEKARAILASDQLFSD
jgi:AmiR/NasT family two-component response regulator